jgi:hypothetical protein
MVAKSAIRLVVQLKQKGFYPLRNKCIALILMMNRNGFSGSEWRAD